MPKRQAASSLEYVLVPITVAPVPASTLTSDRVEMAFVRGANVDYGQAPAADDWTIGLWQVTPQGTFVGLLVGPGGDTQLARGNWVVWVRITDHPEIPAMPADVLTIT